MSDKLIAQKLPLIKSLQWLEKRAVRITIALLGLIIILAIMTVNVAKYESHLASGNQVLLELAPVDPRGFMQGDYMILRYALEDDVLDEFYKSNSSNLSTEGYVIVTLDSHKVGKFTRLINVKPDNLAANEMAIYFRIRNDTMKLATNAFFFQEGHAQAFETAEYGLFRVNKKGEPLLTDMVDEDFRVIKPELINAEGSEQLESLENMGRQGSGM